MIRALIAWGPAATWAAVLFVLSEVGALRPVVFLAVHDKPVHFVLYFVLGAALAWGKGWSGSAWPHWAFVGIGILYGAVDELHQMFVPNRMPSLADLGADALGVAAGYAFMLAAFTVGSRVRAGQAAP